MTWDLLYRKNTFLKQFKKLDTPTQARVRKALKELVDSEDPARLGEYKPSMKVYTYAVGRSHRLLYDIRYNEHKIEIINVGDHKVVYGKD